MLRFCRSLVWLQGFAVIEQVEAESIVFVVSVRRVAVCFHRLWFQILGDFGHNNDTVAPDFPKLGVVVDLESLAGLPCAADRAWMMIDRIRR